MSAEVLYTIGLVLVCLYLLTGIDDFIWDIVTCFRRRSYKKQLLDLHQLDEKPPRLLAIAVAAWHEDNVLGDVIDNIIESVHYPKSMYHIFLGIYPNDEATLNTANQLAAKYDNVHVIINELPGPTSKAQNINYVIREIKVFEAERNWQFASLTIHDAEDVVHPYEFKVTNYLLDDHAAMQFPVFPLMEKPRFGNFFKNITTGTYADEFAENHFTTMVSRYSSGAFVPSAGTGFVLSRATLESFGDEDVLPKDSLTEDYRLSLTLFEKGIEMYYVLERVPRINQENKLVSDFIATRSMFPNTFRTAVKQKTRWILGITMQSFKLREVFRTAGLPFVGRYSMFKDIKAKVGNLLAMVGYPVLIYFIISLFTPLTAIYPAYTLSWYLSIAVTCMMIERQLLRGIAIYKVYGMRSVFFACLLPPIIPIRLVWGNIINLVATLRAYKQNLFGNQTPEKKEKKQQKAAAKAAEKAEAQQVQSGEAESSAKPKLAWAKTDHEFLSKEILKRYHRNIGDILLEKGYIETAVLQKALLKAADNKQSIGSYLIEQGLLDEEHLLAALANAKHIQYVDVAALDYYHVEQFAKDFDSDVLRELLCLPLLSTPDGYVIAFCDDSPIKAQTILRNKYSIQVKAVFASRESIEKGLALMYDNLQPKPTPASMARELYQAGSISYEQLLLVYSYACRLNIDEAILLHDMGLARQSVNS